MTFSSQRFKGTVISLITLLVLANCGNDDEFPPDVVPPTLNQNHPIQTGFRNSEAVFIDSRNNEIFHPRGTNYFNIVPVGSGFQDRFFHPDHFSESEIRGVMRKLKSHGYNTIRIFFDSCNGDPGCVGKFDGPGLNLDYMRNVTRLMQMAEEEDVFLLLTSNDLPDEGGYWDISNLGANELIDGYRNSHYITAAGIEAATKYWKDVMVTLHELKAPFSHVLAWSILNEQWFFNNAPPFTLNSGTVHAANGKSYSLSSSAEKETMAAECTDFYINSVAKVIKEYDPRGMVTMGIFSPNTPHLWRPGDFKLVSEAVTENASLDFLDLHIYPGTSTMVKLMENYMLSNPEAKPMIVGEVGAFIDQYPNLEGAERAVQNWIATSCEYGFDGWLTWGLTRAPEAIGDATWSMLEENERLLVELSPQKYPDPCTDEWKDGINLAQLKPVKVSAQLNNEIGDFAVDGDLTTQWGSGGGPPQWIEIDLQEEISLKRISMIVAQFPAGSTKHEIYTSGAIKNFSLLAEFSENTKEGDRLEWTGAETKARYVRIETKASPSWVSWKEIEIY